jgi:hypothetical protein
MRLHLNKWRNPRSFCLRNWSSEIDLNINENTIVVANNQQVTGDLPDGDVVILSLKDGVYYGLNEVGARIWKLIQQPVRVSQVNQVLLGEYDVDAEKCYQDVVRLLNELFLHGLLRFEQEAVITLEATGSDQ